MDLFAFDDSDGSEKFRLRLVPVTVQLIDQPSIVVRFVMIGLDTQHHVEGAERLSILLWIVPFPNTGWVKFARWRRGRRALRYSSWALPAPPAQFPSVVLARTLHS